MKRIFDQAVALASSRTARDTYILSVGNIGAALLAVVFTIFAARALGPEGFGIVGAAISFIVIVEAIGDFGLGSALFRFVSSEWSGDHKKRAEDTLKAIFLLRLATAVLVLIILAGFSTVLSRLVFGLDQPLLVVLAGIAVFGYLLLDFQITSFQARSRWSLSVLFTVFTNLLRLGLLFLLLVLNRASAAYVVGIFAASPVLSFLISLFWQRVALTTGNNWESVIGKIVPFSSWLGVNRVASAMAGRIDVLLLLAISGAYSAGIFSAAKQLIIGVPLIVGSIATVMAPRFASARGLDIVIFFKKTVWLSVLLSIGLGAGILMTPLVIQLFGPDYQESTRVLQLLLLGHIPFVLSMPAVNVLIYTFGKTAIIAITSLVTLPLVYFANLFLIPSLGANAPAVIIGVANFFIAVIAYSFSWYYLKRK